MANLSVSHFTQSGQSLLPVLSQSGQVPRERTRDHLRQPPRSGAQAYHATIRRPAHGVSSARCTVTRTHPPANFPLTLLTRRIVAHTHPFLFVRSVDDEDPGTWVYKPLAIGPACEVLRVLVHYQENGYSCKAADRVRSGDRCRSSLFTFTMDTVGYF